MYIKRIAIAAVLALLFLPLCAFKGCTNWEKTTYQALAASQQTLNDAQTAYEVSAATGNCTAALAATPPVPCIPHTAAAFKSITTGKAAWKTATDGMIAYETVKNANPAPTANALAAAQNDVVAALSQVGTIVADVKALYAVTGGKK